MTFRRRTKKKMLVVTMVILAIFVVTVALALADPKSYYNCGFWGRVFGWCP